jgi:hypothetical protein
VEQADLSTILAADFHFSNGRRSSGSVHQPARDTSRLYSVTVLLETKESEGHLADEVYDWLHNEFRFSLVYMGSPTRELFVQCLELHQMFNRGLVEFDIERALNHRALFDHLDLAA